MPQDESALYSLVVKNMDIPAQILQPVTLRLTVFEEAGGIWADTELNPSL